MFTGLIESVGRIAAVTAGVDALALRLESTLAAELAIGDSLSVNGVCLTVRQRDEGAVLVDIGPETARVTTAAAWRVGDAVNLERAMLMNGRLGGHFVLGHIDGVGHVERLQRQADSRWVTVRFAAELAPYFIPKGSVAVDGVSLTVAALREQEFDVQLIPYTWDHTAFRGLQIGDAVNLECDMIGKYVVRYRQTQSAQISPIDSRNTDSAD